MLDIHFIRSNPDLIKKNCADRLVTVDIDRLLSLDEEYRQIETKTQELRSRRNKGSKTKPTPEEIKAMKELGKSIADLEEKSCVMQAEIKQILFAIPNLTHPKVTTGDDNPVLETVGKPAKFRFQPKDHLELAEALDLIDLERGAKVTGAKFYFLKNELVLLNLALLRYSLEIICRHGFSPMITPDLAKQDIIEGLGFNPRGESSQIYKIANEPLGLIGTAEVTLGGYHADETLNLSEPLRYVGLSHCFRTEAGSYSKFSKGIFRVHQFEKLEMFVYCTPEQAEKEHKQILAIQKEIFSGLKIPFRVVDHTTTDLGTPAYRTFDLEAWFPGKPNQAGATGDWAEITSVSNCTDYQSRALNIKYQNESGAKVLAYTLNGTGNPGPRALIAILENYQEKDGSITIPKKLRPYLPFKKIK